MSYYYTRIPGAKDKQVWQCQVLVRWQDWNSYVFLVEMQNNTASSGKAGIDLGQIPGVASCTGRWIGRELDLQDKWKHVSMQKLVCKYS